MNDVPKEIYYTNIIVNVFWVAIVLAILIISKRNKRVQLFKNKMLGMWKYSLDRKSVV